METPERLGHAIHRAATWLEGQQAKAAIGDTYEYDVIRETLAGELFDAFMGYASTSGRVTSFRNAAGRAILESFADAFYRGYEDAGGEETEDEDEAWLTSRQATEIGHLPGVFEWIKEQREAETITEDAIQARVESWAAGLDGVYAEGKLRGNDNKMLTFDGDDGEESCAQCQKYKGQRHSAKWWVKRDLVRRNGNENYDCGRWVTCHHDLYTDDGELYA